MTILLETDKWLVTSLSGAVGGEAEVAGDFVAVRRLVAENPEHDLVVVGPTVDLKTALEFAADERATNPALGVVLVRRRIDTAVLKEALRAGVREVVNVDDLTAITEACRESMRVSRYVRGDFDKDTPANADLGRLVTVFSAKGGCGKTVLATNLSAAFAKAGNRVCLVDLDLAFGDVAITMQTQPTRTIGDALKMSAGLDRKAVGGLVVPYGQNLDLLLAPVQPGVAEQIPASVITEFIHALKQMYDVVVVDSPPAFSDTVLAAFDETDMFILMATLDVPAVKNLKLTLEMLEVLGYAKERFQLVVNRADAKVGLTVADVEKLLSMPTAAMIPSSRAVPTSVNRGKPLLLDAPSHAVSTAITKLATHITTTMSPDAADKVAGRHRSLPRLRRRGEAVTA